MSKRIEYLDSFRGFAAISVLLHHILIATPLFFAAHEHRETGKSMVNLFSESPLHTLWAGHEAVIMFFILSGFVLALPSYDHFSFSIHAMKRITRIYFPYIISIILSVILLGIINPSPIEGMSANFNNQWGHEVTLFSGISYLFMLGYDTFNVNGPVWTLVHELRISLLFPFLIGPIRQNDWKKVLLLGISISLILFTFFSSAAYVVPSSGVRFLSLSLADSFYYTSFFIIGSLLAKNRERIAHTVSALSKNNKILLFGFFLLLYNFEWVFPSIGEMKFSDSYIVSKFFTIMIDFVIALSISILFSLGSGSRTFQKAINNNLLARLGKLSFSIYLIHMVVILTTVHVLHSYMPIPVLLVLSFIFSIIAAIPFHHFVEKPFIRLGRKLEQNRSTKNIAAS